MKFKKALSAALALSMVGSLSMSVFADWQAVGDAIDSNPTDSRNSSVVISNPYQFTETVPTTVYDKDGEVIDYLKPITYNGSTLVIDTVTPNETIYIPISNMTYTNVDGVEYADLDGTNGQRGWLVSVLNGGTLGGNSATTAIKASDLADDDLFSFKAKKDTNSSLVKSISVEGSKKLTDASARADYLKIELNDSTMTSEKKFEGTITFKAKKTAYGSTSKTLGKYAKGTSVRSGDTVELKLIVWVNNKPVDGSDGNADTGDRIYFDPQNNETNTFVWGDDRAALKFDANDDPDKFYCRLSTAVIRDVYTEFGDPVNAELYFYNFVGNQTIPARSRARLTLGIPWDDDDDIAVAPEDCYIYQLDNDGILYDVTKNFKYSVDDEEIEGWTTLTRMLGTFIVSDTELDLSGQKVNSDNVSSTEELPSSTTSTPSTPSKVDTIPNTGSNDMVNVAVMAAVLSLAAAGVVAFKKASK